VLVGLEVLKAGHGWSDEEMFHHFCFDVQVRYALGLRALLPVGLTLRTVYAFRKALRQHQEQTGEDLFGLAVEQVTDAQIAAYGLKTDQQRMDSFQIASNPPAPIVWWATDSMTSTTKLTMRICTPLRGNRPCRPWICLW